MSEEFEKNETPENETPEMSDEHVTEATESEAKAQVAESDEEGVEETVEETVETVEAEEKIEVERQEEEEQAEERAEKRVEEQVEEQTEERVEKRAEKRAEEGAERPAEERVSVKKEKKEHPMRRVEIDKVVINIGVGQSGEKLKNAEKILEQITGQKPVETLAKRTIQPFGIKKGEPIGCKVTLRKERAVEFLRRVFKIQNKVFESQFDEFGNLSFGIEEHTDLGIPYDPAVGIFGMNVSVSLKRPGFRIKYRRIQRRKLPKNHLVTREEGISFFMREFCVKVVKE